MGSHVVDVDGSGSESSRSASGKSGSSSRTPPNCARCHNHKIKVPLQGHKRYCLFRNCACKDCILTKQRQHVMAKQTARRRAQTQDEIMERKLKEETERIARGEPPSNLSLFNHPLTPNAHHSSCIEQDKTCSYQNCNLCKEKQTEHSCHRGEPMGLYNLPPSTPGSSIDVEASHMPSSGDEDTAGTPSPRLAPSRPHVYRPPGMESEPNGVIPTRDVQDDIIWGCIGSVLKECHFHLDPYIPYSLLYIIMKHLTCDVDRICDMIRAARLKTQSYNYVMGSTFQWPWLVYPLPSSIPSGAPVDTPPNSIIGSLDYQSPPVQDYRESYRTVCKTNSSKKKTVEKRYSPYISPVKSEDQKPPVLSFHSIEYLQKSADKQIKFSPPLSPPSDAIDYSMKIPTQA